MILPDLFLERAQIMLINDEGCRLQPYRDSAGKLTVGVGHNLDARPITYDAALAILRDDIEDAIHNAYDIFGAEFFEDLPEARRLALLNMIFNLGPGGFKLFHRLIGAVARGDWNAAADEALDSAWAFQVDDGPGGRIGRADRVAMMLRDGVNPYDRGSAG